MLVAENRPRNLSWLHAGPLLFGDWGTSRLYVLGLAFFYTAHASVYYLAAMSVIMIAVAWAYTIICRCFPEGGGVYSSARQINHTLAVVGATLLLCDYIVTVSLSTIEAFHYLGVPEHLVLGLSITTIVLLGVVNWLGARSAARLALFVAIAAMIASLSVAVLSIPFLGRGLATMSASSTSGTNWDHWQSLVRIMLALSGVEAVSNMTGLMKQPVAKTAKRTIWPVLIEVVIFNLIFGIALAGLPVLAEVARPDYYTHVIDRVQTAPPEAPITAEAALATVPEHVTQYRDTAMKVLATEAGQHTLGPTGGLIFGKIAAIIFGLLLLSASNTAIMAMVSVTYSMSRDKELPRFFNKLNYSGVPAWGLVLAVAAPILVLVFEKDVVHLAELYAVGVCGAITINILCCSLNRALVLSKVERLGLTITGLLMLAVEVTIIATKPHAALFAGGIVGVVLVTRFIIRTKTTVIPETVPEPAMGWLAEIPSGPLKIAANKPRIMLAARGRDQAEFAVDLARKRDAVLFVIYVRTLRLIDVAPGQIPKIEDDKDAQQALGTVAQIARQGNVQVVPVYVTSTDIAGEILDYTVTYGCDTLIMGKSRRGLFSRAVVGDVLSEVARQLPDGVALITRTANASPGPASATSILPH